ncbi:uncharacterized protein LOC108733652 [Agrilus planipennis]|uniref:Uncharacterized protein LOC108733652 n=1 Tax=Agrilus planipennis TaxID=224129 RepID=A0A7F5RG38_AGRPL|nr:uncharacterized protein LOC108733652 [Agrilus planipennis]XP_025834970.1 uncharacterized protein LOC108733652 [Agrilus planipennis]
MTSDWKRSHNIPFPTIWHRFTGRKPTSNGELPNFWVQDMPEDLYEVAINLMQKHFLRDEPLGRFSKAIDNPVFVEEWTEVLNEVLKDRLALVCFMENPDKTRQPIIAGLNITAVARKDEKLPQGVSKQGRQFVQTAEFLSKMKDPFDTLGVNEYLTAYGLLVLPEFRGQNLGLEILKAREPLCKAVGLKATVTMFTSIISQKLAERAGFKVLSEISYLKLEEIDPFLTFPGIHEHTKNVKNMYLTYE